MSKNPFSITSLLLALAVLSIPGIIWFERAHPQVWQNRLAIPFLEEEPNRHTPRHALGTYLPPVIQADLALTAADNPVLVSSQTHVAPGATLTLAPGTQLYFHEFAGLIITGKLQARGSRAQPIILASNEVHPENQAWSGLIFTAQSEGQLDAVHISDASPAISCLADSVVTAQAVQIQRGSVGVYTTSNHCQLIDSRINGARDGVVAVGAKAQLHNTTVSARHQEVREIFGPLRAP
ncbi:MAG: hypothetical protein WEA04_01805 [Candidatus Andersenbacteria bacterium]